MPYRMKSGIALLVIAAGALLMSTAALAQDQPVPKWEIFAGYSWADANAKLNGIPFRNYPRGLGVAGTYDFNKWVGLTLDFGGHYNSNTSNGGRINSNLNTLMAGPKLTFRGEHFSPFLEVLVGVSRLKRDHFEPDHRFGFQAGAGIDMNLNRHWALRLIQADFIGGVHHQLDSPTPGTPFKPVLHGVRLQGGIVYLVGGAQEEKPVSASLSLEPTSVMAGEAIKATAAPNNFPPKNKLTYTWNSTGGKVAPNDATATIDTTGLAPGNYTVGVHVTDNKKHNAEASSSFTVREPPKNAPTMSCSANPTTVRSGDPATITCQCQSPDGRPVTVSNWTASAGKISGSGNTATLDTAGTPAGPVSVSASCSDDRGLTVLANTTVNVEVPPPAPTASKACEIEFTNKAKAARVDNAAKGCLDGVADSLLQNPNSKAVLVGDQEATEKPKTLAAQRAVNTKAYLTSGENQKAVDASRIETRTSSTANDKKVEVWTVPEGATFEQPGTTTVNETRVKPQSRKPAAAAPARRKAAATK